MPFGLSFLFGRKLTLIQEEESGEPVSKRSRGDSQSQSQLLFFCPSCQYPYDMGKKRKLLDSCGHQRCYTCIYQDENCQFCYASVQEPTAKKQNGKRNPNSPQLYLKKGFPAAKSNSLFKTRFDSASPSIISTSSSSQSSVLNENPRSCSRNSQNSSLSKDCMRNYVRNSPMPKRNTTPYSPMKWGNGGGLRISGGRKTLPSLPDEDNEEHEDEGFEEVSGEKLKNLKKNRKRKFVPSYWEIYSRIFSGNKCKNGQQQQQQQNRPKIEIPSKYQSTYAQRDIGINESSSASTMTGSSSFAIDNNDNGATTTLLSSESMVVDGDQFTILNVQKRAELPRGKIISPVIKHHGESWAIKNRVQQPLPINANTIIIEPNQMVVGNFNSWPMTTLVDKGFPPLRPLFFEVPIEDRENVFNGRNWLFKEILDVFTNSDSYTSTESLDSMCCGTTTVQDRGIIISGGSGSGKTAIVLQLVQNSCFGRGVSTLKLMDSSAVGVSREFVQSLASHVVAYHFCQVDNSRGCLVPEFVHSLAAQLCQAPQLASFREYLLSNPSTLARLSLENCLVNPSRALIDGILEPLVSLQKFGSLDVNNFLLILIDGLDEAEYHRTDTGDTISTFLAKHFLRFPPWLKILITLRSNHQDTVSLMPFHKINLDKIDNEHIKGDLFAYVNLRIKGCFKIRSNIIVNCKGETFKSYLVGISGGSFLFLKLTLDLIQLGHLVIKSKNFKVLPVSLSELFLLHCNLRFPTVRSFEKVEAILAICLAALSPLTLLEIYHSVNSLMTSGPNSNSSKGNKGGTCVLSWENYLEIFKSLTGLLVKRSDETYMFFHSSFREWLLRREEFESKKFLCDIRKGHAAISFRLSRIEAPLGVEKTLELGHHILKANIYKNTTGSIPARDLQAIWLTNSSVDLSATLSSHFNIFYPNIKVSRLLLLAGASPNAKTNLEGEKTTTVLAIACTEGYFDFAATLIEFGADLKEQNSDGETPIHLAAAHGHVNIIRLLTSNGVSPFLPNIRGESPFFKACMTGQLDPIAYYLSMDFLDSSLELSEPESTSVNQPNLKENEILYNVAMQGLIGASSQGHLEIVEYIIEKICPDLESFDSLMGETVLTSAAQNGRLAIMQFLINDRKVNVHSHNSKNFSPIQLAAKGGHADCVQVLINHGGNINESGPMGCSPLILAAKEGHSKVVEILLSSGANCSQSDSDCLSALSWASLKGHLTITKLLLEQEEGSIDINGADNLGRTPLDLAAFSGNEEIVQFLLEKGAALEHVDLQGIRPLDRAVGCGHKGVVELFLKRGAKLGPATWMATGNPEITLTLLKKLLEDGKVLARKGQLKDAAYRFEYAIRKLPLNQYTEEMGSRFEALRLTFLIQLSRIKRKMHEFECAIRLASEAILYDPESFKAICTRAKAYKASNAIESARADLLRARDLTGNRLDLRKQLARLSQEIAREGSRSISPSC